MPEFLSPGIFIEEVNAGGQTVQAVGTSTMAIVGWTTRGVTDQATLITSPAAFSRTFGDFTRDSLVPISVSAYFSNGGTRCYVVRVAPTDAVAGTSSISESVVGEIPGVTAGSTISPAEDGVALGPFTVQLAQIPLDSSDLTITWDNGSARTATLSGATTLTASGTDAAGVASASIDRTTGVLTITFAATYAPNANTLTVSYAYSLWTLAAANVGAWSSNLRFTLKGNDNFFVYGTPGTTNAGTWTKYDVLISLLNETTGSYEVKETYDELSFSDSTDAMYAPEVINDASDFVVMTDLGALDVPSTFKGVTYLAEVAGTGDGATLAFSYTLLNFPVVPVSPVLHYTIGAVAKTATPDADGVFSGTDFDATKTNLLDYTDGTLTLNFVTAPDNAVDITIDYIAMPTTLSVDYSFSNGSDGTLTIGSSQFGRNQFTGPTLQANKLGMYALDRVDEMMQLVIPDWAGDTTVMGDQVDYAENRRDIFVILATPKGLSAQKAVNFVRITYNRFSKYSAIYWPWLTVADPLVNNRSILMPAMSHVAGIYARTDLTKNVGKSPAGTVDGALRYLTGFEHNPDKGERDTVSPARINSLINTPQTGMAVWGARTLAADSAWKYINAVRLFMFVEKSTFNSTHQFVFENIGQTLYSQIKTQLDGFLLNLFNNGYFAGTSPTQAYFVVCDSSNNPPEVVNAGEVIVDVGLAPNKPGEFIRFRFQQIIQS